MQCRRREKRSTKLEPAKQLRNHYLLQFYISTFKLSEFLSDFSHRNSIYLAKKGEDMGKRVRRDRLSNLPLSIIHEILARVPIEDAIGTSLLSKQWRYTWTTLPRLVFNCDGDDVKEIEEDPETTETFISNVLLHHKGPLHSFKMHCFEVSFNIDSIEKWMLSLSRKDIRELSIRLDWDDMCVLKNLKSSIYTFVKLTKLELGALTFHPPPSSFKGFLALTTLDLCNIELSTDGVESLVAGCPLLETLKMIECSCLELRIRSTNLKNLILYGDEHVELCLYAPLLATMHVNLPSLTETVAYNYTNLLGCFTNLVKLKLHKFTKYLSIGIESCQDTLVFHHLRNIELIKVDFADTKELSVLVRLIKGAPNLHKLVMSCVRGYSAEAPYVSFEFIGCEPNFTLEKLRDVELYSVCNHLSGMNFIKLLLESSPVLETVDLGLISPKAAAELLRFRRSSTKC